jgi:hypothetical protein
MKLRLHFFFRLSGKPIKHKHVKYGDKGIVRDIGAKSVFRVHSFALGLTEMPLSSPSNISYQSYISHVWI